jgi:uncharacterized membrane protein
MAEAETNNDLKRRAQRALHRFTEQLDAEVQEALDAARGRHFAPIESVVRRCEYVLARYLTAAQGRALSADRFPIRKAGISFVLRSMRVQRYTSPCSLVSARSVASPRSR